MMTALETQHTVTCYRCGVSIQPGQGRYHVFPRESYCSFECLRQALPHIAEAITQFAQEPRQIERWEN